MAFSYDKLWKLLIDKKMTKENFRLLIKASPTTIAAMGKGEGISPKVLERICMAFDCQPGDIMEYVPNQSNPNHSDSQNRMNKGLEWHNQRTEDYSDLPTPNALGPKHLIDEEMNQHTENR